MDILLEVCRVMMSWLFVYNIIAAELDENPQFKIWNIAYSSIKYFIPRYTATTAWSCTCFRSWRQEFTNNCWASEIWMQYIFLLVSQPCLIWKSRTYTNESMDRRELSLWSTGNGTSRDKSLFMFMLVVVGLTGKPVWTYFMVINLCPYGRFTCRGCNY